MVTYLLGEFMINKQIFYFIAYFISKKCPEHRNCVMQRETPIKTSKDIEDIEFLLNKKYEGKLVDYNCHITNFKLLS